MPLEQIRAIREIAVQSALALAVPRMAFTKHPRRMPGQHDSLELHRRPEIGDESDFESRRPKVIQQLGAMARVNRPRHLGLNDNLFLDHEVCDTAPD